MPAPDSIRPSQVKSLIPSTGGGFCDKFLRFATGLGQTFYDLVLYEIGEDGLPTSDFKADICALGCTGSGTGSGGTNPENPDLDAPSSVNATDGAFADKVRVTWSAVTPPSGGDPVLTYRIYRSLATNSDPNSATLIGTVNAPTVQYDDSTAVAGTIYNYWAKAKSASQTSAFGGPDNGSASSPSVTLPAISDLRATIGFGLTKVALVWTPPAGATAYDVYRGTTGTYSAATKIYSDIEPASTYLFGHPTNDPTFWFNDPEVLLFDSPPSPATDYHYWVVSKKSSPPATSPESNSPIGRVNAPAIYNITTIGLDFTGATYTVDTGITKMWAVLYGGNGGGAGGGSVYGGGGGGGGGTVQEAFTVVAGDVITMTFTPSQDETGNAASATNGAAGSVVRLKKNGTTILTANAGHGGVYSSSGAGAGGAGDTATGTTSPTIYAGHAGKDGEGSQGGRSGYTLVSQRSPGTRITSPAWDGSGGGGGSAFPINPALAIGGSASSGSAFLALGT